eukprot:GFUD01115672.1.p1 GENE.GFUD01115672.1~~GFUD01115672.1.p1  ORF type:complete len:597 (+),score=147.72 GFUD01115672.1:182-1972(+)
MMTHVGVLSLGTMSRDLLPKCFLLLLLLLPKCWAAYDFVTLGDTPGLVKDNNRYLLVSLEGDSIDLVCNANAAIYPPKTFQWEKNGKVEKQGNLMIEEHFKIMNIDEDMDDLTFTCRYSIFTKNHKGLPSWNEWAVTVELAVFKLTVQATNITCANGVGDLQLSFKEARKNRNDQANLETKIKSKLEDLSGLSLSYGYSVTVPFEKVLNSVTLIAMKPIFVINGTTASCPMFKEVPKIDKRCPTSTVAAQKLEPRINSEDDKAHKKKKHKNNRMKISSITPNEAQADDPVKIIILADNLPQPGEILVVFSTPEWTKEVKPVNQHHNHALEVFTPKLDHKILHKTKVSVKLVRSSNKIETKPVELFFLPDKETHQDSPPKQDLENNDQCSTKAAQIGTYVVIAVAGAVLGFVLSVCLYKHAMKKKIEKKVCTQSGPHHNNGHSLVNTSTVSIVWLPPKLCPQSGHQDKEDTIEIDWNNDSLTLDRMMEETREEESSPCILGSKQEEPIEDMIGAAPPQVVVHPRPKKKANTENREMDLFSPTSDEPHIKNRDRSTSSVPAIKPSSDAPQTKKKDMNKSLLPTKKAAVDDELRFFHEN